MTLGKVQIIEQAKQLAANLPKTDREETRKKLWAEEGIRRRHEVQAGMVKAIPGEQVLAEIRRVVGQ